jgi:BirA family biotin operon repressor/biotin-[acetyl-CoA-carboxylase] ligase
MGVAQGSVQRAGRAVFPAFQLRHLARTSSTQDVVRAAAARGAEEGLCCVADLQTAGRGRSGRVWSAPAGTALLASLLLRRSPPAASGVPLAAGLAVADAVTQLTGVACRLKWPNDVLAGGGKLAGILTEVEPSGGIILGIGVNLNVPALDPAIRAVSLHRLSPIPVSWDALLGVILRRLGEELTQLEAGGIPGLRGRWAARAAGLGGPIRASLGDRIVEGTAVGIDDQGALIVATEGGEERLIAGDVHLVPG